MILRGFRKAGKYVALELPSRLQATLDDVFVVVKSLLNRVSEHALSYDRKLRIGVTDEYGSDVSGSVNLHPSGSPR